MSWTMDELLRRVRERAKASGLRCKGDLYVAIRMALGELGIDVRVDESIVLPVREVAVVASDRERIVRAAIRHGDAVYSVPRPGRHCDVCRMMVERGLPSAAMESTNQGFLTSEGRWVDRAEGARLAAAAGQLLRGIITRDMLTSEDVW